MAERKKIKIKHFSCFPGWIKVIFFAGNQSKPLSLKLSCIYRDITTE
jgi:hypothetical protein